MNVLSLFDYTGNWPYYYKQAGHYVKLIDIKHGDDILTWKFWQERRHYDVVLAAFPCTEFSVSGAQYWKQKDEDGRTADALRLVEVTTEILLHFSPEIWALENPVGRIRRMFRGEYRDGEPHLNINPVVQNWLRQPKLIFNPCEYGGWLEPEGDKYTKRTLIWGEFNELQKKEVEPEFLIASNGDKYSPIHMNTGGKSERTKELRSATPMGFARAFYEANHF
jgi:site-specific DNA-cytosine methylase